MGKYFIFLSLIETKHPVLAVFAVLYIVPALYYYFRIVVHAWLKQPGEAPRPSMTSASRGPGHRGVCHARRGVVS
jgi:NADH:ubiquinone oxidoreductase subunit 2 (subunit N)